MFMEINTITLTTQILLVGLWKETSGHPKSGIAVLLSDNEPGQKQMYVGRSFSGMSFYDYLGNRSEKVLIDANGNGTFFVNGGSVSAWICEE